MTTFTKQVLVFLLGLSLFSCSEQQPAYQPLSRTATILAFGDSLTAGNGATKQQAYPNILSGLSGLTVINAGISGELSAAGLRRLPALLAQHQPGLIIICHGGNDILRKLDLQQTKTNLAQMINLANRAQAQVLLLAVPRPSLTLTPPEFYSQLAGENKIPINMTILPEILGNQQLKSDIYHPNAAGYTKLAQSIYQQLVDEGALPI